MKENVRELYVRTDKCLFADEQSLVQKYDIGGTIFWPIEDFDMVYKFNYKNFIVLTLLYIVQALEISYYLLGLQSDIENRAVSILGTKMKRIIVPEVRRILICVKK